MPSCQPKDLRRSAPGPTISTAFGHAGYVLGGQVRNSRIHFVSSAPLTHFWTLFQVPTPPRPPRFGSIIYPSSKSKTNPLKTINMMGVWSAGLPLCPPLLRGLYPSVSLRLFFSFQLWIFSQIGWHFLNFPFFFFFFLKFLESLLPRISRSVSSSFADIYCLRWGLWACVCSYVSLFGSMHDYG